MQEDAEAVQNKTSELTGKAAKAGSGLGDVPSHNVKHVDP
jgi:hypothetical protein